jgi:hypothetical protein
MTLLDAALTLRGNGLSVVPIRTDGSKSPAVPWKNYTAEIASEAVVTEWFANDTYDGVGIVCGTVSGNVELLEFEACATDLVPKFAALLQASGYTDLWHRISTGYLVRSPSGGMHWVYRVDGPAKPNTKLARRPGKEPNTVDVLIETRGENGQVVTAPSGGRTHPTGNGWVMLSGGPSTIPTISIAERDALYMAAQQFDTMPAQEYDERSPQDSSRRTNDGLRPGEDYDARVDWAEILNPHGWQIGPQMGLRRGWIRPGKDRREGISATTGGAADGVDRLYVFSTSTIFETEEPYTKFGAYALLNHGGDFSAAARELRRQGYGDQSEPAKSDYAMTFTGKEVGPLQVMGFEGGEPGGDTVTFESAGITDVEVTHSHMRDGASFILDAPETVPSIWGNDDDCLWSVGEALMMCGPPGVGKTTITGQVVRGLLGLQETVLGLPVAPAEGRVLYLAMDRPQQIARSLRRVFGESERQLLEDKVRIWEGPPPGDVAKQPGLLLDLARKAEATHLVVDSMKDAAVGLTEDEVAAAYNRARQTCLANGVQVLELHHMVKRGVGGTKPNQLADVYGSAWLTAGAGSVVLIWGAAGDPIVELVHLKQPASEVGPWRLIHDHDTGHTAIHHATDLLQMLLAAGGKGVTAKAAACVTFDKENPKAPDVEKVRRRLDKLVNQGHATREDRPNGTAGGKPTGVYRVGVWSNHGAITEGIAETPNHAITEQSRETAKPQVRAITEAITAITHPEQSRTPPSLHQTGRAVLPAVEMLNCNMCGRAAPAKLIEVGHGICGGCSLL